MVVGECQPFLEMSLVAKTECGPEVGECVDVFLQSRHSNRALSSDTRDHVGLADIFQRSEFQKLFKPLRKLILIHKVGI